MGKDKKEDALWELHHTDGGSQQGGCRGDGMGRGVGYFAGRKSEWEMRKIGLPPLKIKSRTKFVWAHNIYSGTAHKLNHTHKHK